MSSKRIKNCIVARLNAISAKYKNDEINKKVDEIKKLLE